LRQPASERLRSSTPWQQTRRPASHGRWSASQEARPAPLGRWSAQQMRRPVSLDRPPASAGRRTDPSRRRSAPAISSSRMGGGGAGDRGPGERPSGRAGARLKAGRRPSGRPPTRLSRGNWGSARLARRARGWTGQPGWMVAATAVIDRSGRKASATAVACESGGDRRTSATRDRTRPVGGGEARQIRRRWDESSSTASPAGARLYRIPVRQKRFS
jgi:hypothetical protein